MPRVRSRALAGTSLELIQGDITVQQVDAVVNAANSGLLGGGGVDGAIHRAGGPAILQACRQLRQGTLPDGLPAGQAVATTGGRLLAAHVIHTVGPVYSARQDRSSILASCYRSSLGLARELGVERIAFPAVSAGVYGWPLPDAARIALETTADELLQHGRPALVRFVLFSAPVFDAFERALDAL